MSKIRDKAEIRVAEILGKQGWGVHAGARLVVAAEILSITELAVVDRNAEPPELPTVLLFTECLPSELHNRLLKIQQDMLKADWVKEVKE